jgi:hypothetical protein
MARHVWTVLCERSLTDPDGGAISLLGVIEKITVHEQPDQVERQIRQAQEEDRLGVVFPMRMQLITWWVRSDYSKPETTTTRVSFVNPSGRMLLEQEVSIDLLDNTGRRMTLRFDVFPLTMFGLHWFVVEQKRRPAKPKESRWAVMAKFPVEVELASSALNASTGPEPPSGPTPDAPQE